MNDKATQPTLFKDMLIMALVMTVWMVPQFAIWKLPIEAFEPYQGQTLIGGMMRLLTAVSFAYAMVLIYQLSTCSWKLGRLSGVSRIVLGLLIVAIGVHGAALSGNATDQLAYGAAAVTLTLLFIGFFWIYSRDGERFAARPEIGRTGRVAVRFAENLGPGALAVMLPVIGYFAYLNRGTFMVWVWGLIGAALFAASVWSRRNAARIDLSDAEGDH